MFNYDKEKIKMSKFIFLSMLIKSLEEREKFKIEWGNV